MQHGRATPRPLNTGSQAKVSHFRNTGKVPKDVKLGAGQGGEGHVSPDCEGCCREERKRRLLSGALSPRPSLPTLPPFQARHLEPSRILGLEGQTREAPSSPAACKTPPGEIVVGLSCIGLSVWSFPSRVPNGVFLQKLSKGAGFGG